MEPPGGEGKWDTSMEKRGKKTPPGHREIPACLPPIPVERPSPPAPPSMDVSSSIPAPERCHRTHSQIILRLSLPKPNPRGSSKPFSMIPHPLAGPGVELRDGYGHAGKGHDSRDLQPNMEISPQRGKRGEKTLGNPFFLPKSKPQHTLRLTPFPLPMRRTQTHGSSQNFFCFPRE